MKNRITCLLCGAIIMLFALMCAFLPKKDFSESERRLLAAKPQLNAETVFSGSFAKSFEEYSTDTFPFRDNFRTIKAYSSKYLFNKSDNNGLFYQSGHLSKVDYPQNENMLDHAAERFTFVYDKYLKESGANVYFSIIPDKNYFLRTLKYDYAAFSKAMQERLPEFTYIDIFPNLSLGSYYTTDSHWRQEKLGGVASKIATAIGVDITSKYTMKTLDRPFYGVYSGQAALKTAPDTINYLTSDILSACTVLRANDNTGMLENSEIYDFEKAQGRDAYELFLSGNSAVITIENPNAKEVRELIIFRDSFGSSLAPLLVPAYSKITVFDLRYISPSSLSAYANFDNCDVLFIYNTSMLNSSLAIK